MRRSAFLAVALTLGGSAGAGAAGPLRLEDALTRAHDGNPTLHAAAADVAAARARLRQARLLPANPVLSAEVARHTGPGSEEQIDRGVSLGQEIEVGGQRGLRAEAAARDVTRAEQALADRRRTVDAEVRRAFFGVAADEQLVALARERVALAERLADTARRRAGAGEVGALDAQLAGVEAARAAQALAAAETTRAAELLQLGAALGAGPDESLTVATEEVAPVPIAGEAVLVSRALNARPDLAAARAERARLEAEAALVHRSGIVPNPTVRAFYRAELLDEHIAGGEISVALPVWNREQGTEVALREQAAAAGAETDRIALEIPRQVHLALVRRAAAAATWERYRREALPAASTARAELERAYSGGYLGLADVLVQEDRLLQARSGSIEAWRDVHVADADLIEAVAETP